MHPGAECGEFPVEHVAAGVKLRLGHVVRVGCPHRTHHRDPVDLPGHVRKPIAHLDATLTMLAKSCLQREEHVPLLAVGIGSHRPLQLQLFRILHVGIRRLRDCPAAVFGEHRLRIEALHVAHAAVHEQPDHALGPGGKVRPTVGRGPADRIGLGSPPLAIEQRCQCHAGDPLPHAMEEATPGRHTQRRMIRNAAHDGDSADGEEFGVVEQRPDQLRAAVVACRSGRSIGRPLPSPGGE